MNIEELRIKNFGKFRDTNFSLEGGINLICGENESGKSTVHTFIRGMFFGMRRMRGRASRTDTYSRYEPWEDPGYYAGEIVFESGGKRFRMSRNFSKNQAAEQLVCETDGELLSVADGDLKMLLGGVSETIFDNTVSVGQLKSVTGDGLALELKNYMANCQGGFDRSLDLKKAEEYLKEKRKGFEAALKENQKKQETEKQAILSRLTYERQECDTLRENLKIAEESLDQQVFRREVPRGEVKAALRNTVEKSSRRLVTSAGIAATILVLLCLSALLFLKGSSLVIRCGLALAILVLVGILVFNLRRRRRSVVLEEEKDPLEEKIRKLRWNVEYLRQEIQEKQTAAENAESEYREYCLSCGEKSSLETDVEAVNLALETLKNLSAGMEKRIGAKLRCRMSEILSDLTDGKYLSVSMDAELNMGLHTSGCYVPLSQVSRGTLEQVYLALRLAVMEILCAEEPLPLLLDEVFAMYDDRRLCRALRLLAAQGRQVLIFTCHHREEEMLRRLSIPYHKVRLQEEAI